LDNGTCRKLLRKIFLPERERTLQRETSDTAVEGGEAWSYDIHLVTMRAELSAKVNMLKVSKQELK
jgi:hypothetical protein